MANVTMSTGTPIRWEAAGGEYAITLASLAAGAARQGAKGDLGATRAVRWLCRVEINMDAAPVNGAPVEIWWSSSSSGTAATDNTGAASGADAAYTGAAGGGLAATKLQLQFIGAMPMTADADAVVQVAEFFWYPPQRYGMPIVVNGTAQAFEGDDDSHRITMIPLPESVA
jgi:hypothetical protein